MARATTREWIGLAVLALPCLLYSMDLTVLHLAVPQISADLKPSSAQLLWIVDIYGFLVAGSLITMGTLGDRIGRRKLLLIGAVLFGAASVLAAFSTSVEMLIASRAILGVAGATIAPSTLSLIRNMFFDDGQRTFAVAIWINCYSLGAVIGPLLGGVVLQFFWWGAVFLLAVPVMVLLLILGPLLLPEYRDPSAGRPDIASAVLSLAAVLSAIFGIKLIAQDGLAPLPLASILIGVVVGALFVRRQRRLADPLIDLRLFRVPAFSGSLAVYGGSILVAFGAFLFLPQYLQLVLGLTPFEAGLWTLPWAMGFVVGSMLTPAIVRIVPRLATIVVGIVVAAIGTAMFALFDASTSFAFFAVASVLSAIGLAPAVTLTIDFVIGSAPAERAGAASAISETGAEFGGALGIAVYGSIGVAVYRAAMARAIPTEATAEAAETARDTLGGAVAASEQLPAQVGAQLLESARGAYLDGMHLVAIISAIGSLGLAIFALRMLRKISERLETAEVSTPAE